MRRSITLVVLATLVGMGLMPATPVAKADEAPSVNSPNVTHVANLRYAARPTAGGGDHPQGGTDIEFVNLPVQVGLVTKGPKKKRGPVFETREFALAGTYRNGLQIVDITDPTTPKVASVYDCWIQQGDVQVFERDGRTYATYTHDTGYTATTSTTCYQEAKALGDWTDGAPQHGTFILDITNPYEPTTVAFVPFRLGSHNQTVSPDGNFLYNSNSDLGPGETGSSGTIEVVDISDFSEPKRTATLELTSGLNSHDITFSPDGKRAYSAAVTHTLVLDTTDLAHPTIIGRIIDPAINISHQSDPITMKDANTGLERTFLVITDEIAGAAGNAACPGGGLHVYDVTGDLERAPVKVGYWNIPETTVFPPTGVGLPPRCTAHVLRMYPEQKVMTISWYAAGVRVVDISGLMGVSVGATPSTGNVGVGMKEIGYHYFTGADFGESWSVKTNKIADDGSFYMYSNDQRRGLDVLRFTKTATESENPGRWLTPEEAEAELAPQKQPIDPETNAPICLLPQ
ncbi:MAG: hypothetical protein GEU78_06580 [Actinobacteria bacterium]|nr:hypothetical protein [Actinomycetota bacterium]